MATLNGIELGTGLFKGTYATKKVDAIMNRARSGNPLVWSQPAGPQPIDLIGSDRTGVLQKAILDQVEELAKIAGATYELIYDDVAQLIMFRHWEDEIIIADGLVPREKMRSTDYYNNVQIKLFEAEWR